MDLDQLLSGVDIGELLEKYDEAAHKLLDVALSDGHFSDSQKGDIVWPGGADVGLDELRRRAEQALGDKFDLREFHVVVLEGGSLPLSVLDAKIDRWIESQQ